MRCCRGKSSQAREANVRDDQGLRRALECCTTEYVRSVHNSTSSVTGMTRTHKYEWEKGEGERRIATTLSQELESHAFARSSNRWLTELVIIRLLSVKNMYSQL
jgi:hypothetical protein